MNELLQQNHGIKEPEKIKGETERGNKSTQRNRKQIANGTPTAKHINFYIKRERMKLSTHMVESMKLGQKSKI